MLASVKVLFFLAFEALTNAPCDGSIVVQRLLHLL